MAIKKKISDEELVEIMDDNEIQDTLNDIKDAISRLNNPDLTNLESKLTELIRLKGKKVEWEFIVEYDARNYIKKVTATQK
jgi:hypothetical protein